MDATAFESDLQAKGYVEVKTRSLPPGQATDPHAHEFSIRALVLAGEITLFVDGATTRYGVGQVFTMDQGRQHHETIGPDGVTTLAGRIHR